MTNRVGGYLVKFFLINIRVWLIWGLAAVVGYCFGGKIGIGIAALIILIVQLLP